MILSIKCPNCGASYEGLVSGNCDYCHTTLLLNDFSKMNNTSIQKYTDLYKSIASDDPEYLSVQISLINILIVRKQLSLAENRANELLLEYPDAFELYLLKSVIGLLKNPIHKLKLNDVKDITNLIIAGNDLCANHSDKSFAYLASLIEKHYYWQNGMKVPTPIKDISCYYDENVDVPQCKVYFDSK